MIKTITYITTNDTKKTYSDQEPLPQMWMIEFKVAATIGPKTEKDKPPHRFYYYSSGPSLKIILERETLEKLGYFDRKEEPEQDASPDSTFEDRFVQLLLDIGVKFE